MSTGLVTTTGFTADDISGIQKTLRAAGWVYEASLTVRTSILVAKASLVPSQKFLLAMKRPHLISVVSSHWVTEAHCSREALQHHLVQPEIFGARVSTTSLTEKQRSVIQAVCVRESGIYMTSLCRRCAFLVVADEGTKAGNEKVLYAERHPHIARITYTEFLTRFGTRCPSAVEEVGGRGHQQMVRRSMELSSSCNLRHVVCYCTPQDRVTPDVRRVLHCAGVQRVPILTSSTTHVIVLSESCDYIPHREGLEFVGIEWLMACIEASTEVSTDTFRRLAPDAPTITFSSLSASRKVALSDDIKKSGLHCRVQDTLLLGPVDMKRSSEHSSLSASSHLVVPKECMRTSEKVQAVLRRFEEKQRCECRIVDVSWVEESIRCGQWVDPEPYTTPLCIIAAEQPQSKSICCNALSTSTPCKDLTSSESVGREKGSPQHRPSLDSQKLNLSLEALVGQLERRVSPLTNRVPLNASVVDRPACEDVRRHQTSIVIGPSFTTAGGFSPMASKDSCAFLQLCHGEGLAAQNGGMPVALESQTIVYQADGVPSLSVPPPMEKRVAALPIGAPQKVDSSVSRVAVTLLIAKAVKDDGVTMASLQGIPGVLVVDTPEQATHYVVHKPSKTETFLCCVAAGKWVLQPSFLHACIAERRLVAEEPHEWSTLASGGEPSIARGSCTSSMHLVGACRIQRLLRGGAFRSWRVFLTCSDRNRGLSFARVLRSGGCSEVRVATVADVVATCSGKGGLPDVQHSTHVLTDDNLWDDVNVAYVEQCLHVVVQRVEFLVHTLCATPTVKTDINDFAVTTGSSRKRLRAAE